MRWFGLAVSVLAACGRISFDPAGGVADCAAIPEPNDTPATATPLALGETASGALCSADVDVFAVSLTAGDELEVALAPVGTGWPSLEIVDDAGVVRAVKTYEHTLAGFADHDGVYYVRVAGVAGRDGTPYTLTARKRTNQHFFIAPTGSDANPGTFAAPWQHFDFAVPKLQAGDTLVLLDGTYTIAQNSVFIVDGGTAASGTPAQPIRVVALTERRALLRSDGLQPAMRFQAGCQYWTVDGLRFDSQDNNATVSSNGGVALLIDNSSFITVRRALATHNNRYTNSHLFSVTQSTDVLLEDVEAYDFHRMGVQCYQSQRVTFRRAFAASRGYSDLAGGYATTPSDRGDSGIVLSMCADSLAENSVDEGNGNFTISADINIDSADVRVVGSIARGNEHGFLATVLLSGTSNDIRTRFDNVVAVASTFNGFYVRSNMDFRCTACTSIDAQNSGWVADQLGGAVRVSSASCTNCLAVRSATDGFRVANQDGGWKLDSCNAFGNGASFNPASAPEIVGAREIDPAVGGCLVYLPANSPMRGAGQGGGDIGANILYRYQDGALTDLPLWDPETGAFPCGAVIPGVNDDPATSCIGVHTRLHVGTADCPLPYPAL